jgi:type VI secretion system secreted protein VgrG
MPTHDELTLTLESGDFSCEGLRVRAFSGKEAISRLFAYEIEVECSDHGGPDAEAMTGAKVTLVLERFPGGAPGWHGTRRLHGVVAEVVDLLAEHVELRVYRLHVAPRAFALALVETQDIFMAQSVPQIVKGKLEAVGLGDAVELRLTGEYAAREFVVQYQESDLAFVSRLAEHLGISFFFEHGDAGETMVFADAASGFAHFDGDPLPFRPRGEAHGVFSLQQRRRMVPAYYAVRDYNYRVPHLDLTGEHELPEGVAGGVIEFGAHHKTPAEGKALARVRAEERLAGQLVYTGRSTAPVLGAGMRFKLDDHPQLGSVELLVTELEHRARPVVDGAAQSDEGAYVCSFVAIPADRTYRPARVTQRPRIAGLITGIVDAGAAGPGARYAQLDEQGRYMVRFLFDTTPPGERPASRPVRMIQNHAGEGYGTHFPLKPGVEVVIGFVDGDPDRPLIVGAVPNPIKPSPVTSANPGIHRMKTSTGIVVDMAE